MAKGNQEKSNETQPLVKQSGMPAFVLNMDTRFYLAVAKKTVGKFVFVYTLACAGEHAHYDAASATEIATFDNVDNAEIYYQTIKQAIEYNKKTPIYDALSEFNSGLLKNFNVATR